MSTRVASGKVINALAAKLPELIGGSADLAPSNNTKIDGSPDFQKEIYQGRNLHFGVREHAMGAALNGMTLYGGVIPYGGTFLVFSDYMKPAIRIAALSHIPTIFIFTHDSVGLGEDGPTHQPIEHVAALRAVPNVTVIRPADANETAQAWKVALENHHGPIAFALTRQNVPIFEPSDASAVEKGAYVLKDFGKKKPELILMASGSEVQLILQEGRQLMLEGIPVRVVSFPSWELFAAQDGAYRKSVLPAEIPLRLAVEAGIRQGWDRWIGERGEMLSIDRYGASAPMAVLQEKFGFTVEAVVRRTKDLLNGGSSR